MGWILVFCFRQKVFGISIIFGDPRGFRRPARPARPQRFHLYIPLAEFHQHVCIIHVSCDVART